jgi:hypothetical protein
MNERQQGNDTAQLDGAPKVFGRRGMIAGAAAVAATMVAAKTADSVKANGEVITVGSYIQTITAETHLAGSMAANNALMHLSENGQGLGLESYANAQGVLGWSLLNNGVDGTTNSNNASCAGVYGYGVPGGNGVVGESTGSAGSYGVWGKTDTGKAVVGQASGSGFGGSFTSSTNHGVHGSTFGTGVVAGVYGTSTTAYGVIGRTTAPGYSGLTAITGTPGVAALAATSTVPTAYAAYFQGTTVVQGNFFVVGGGKSAAVPHADGSHRAVYCVESPESWFEDFGKGQLAGGKTDVKLDPEFAAIVHADDYMVFLTPEGDSKGLYVTGKSAGGFAVREQQGGASSLAFSWRVVAKRKDIEGKRLAKVDLPKINTPDLAKMPKMDDVKPFRSGPRHRRRSPNASLRRPP